MLAKTWKKIGLFILIIACMYNVMSKIVKKVSFNKEMESTAVYYNQIKAQEDAAKANEPDDTIKFNIDLNSLKGDYNSLFNN